MTAHSVIDLMQSMSVGSRGERLVGSSPAFVAMLRQIADFALDADRRVLIVGESGTGKEMLARMIHRLSPRSTSPFVACNFAATPEGLQGLEIFGCEKGGCFRNRPFAGKLERSDDGTFFADDVTGMKPSLQQPFLEAVRDRRYRRVDETSTLVFRGRVIFATDAVLLAESGAQGRLSPDLRDWINGDAVVRVPPLRERDGDATLIAEYAISLFSAQSGRRIPLKLTEETRAYLRAREYPCNVRELMNLMEMGVALTPADEEFLQRRTVARPDPAPGPK
jgi:DNA-binding NtrC family response regulator